MSSGVVQLHRNSVEKKSNVMDDLNIFRLYIVHGEHAADGAVG
jgi:hypothetical protein